MSTFWIYLCIFIAGFASGWAFFKHRARIKMKAEAEARSVKQAVNHYAQEAEQEVRSKF